ncbi:MAG TPA: hypothetical protein VLT57_17760 [Bryobacteraceae bacterium]|nr:hypothetical protein [Bryobacteraceae bacterium]
MDEWKLLQKDPSESMAKLHHYSVTKKHALGDVEVRITVKEFATAKTSDMKFYACADVELNQKAMPFKPCGWGETLFCALSDCMRNLRRFDFEQTEAEASATP